MWFNPPYNKSLKTNIGKYFFRLFNKRFPQGHKLYIIFNKNTLKLSYFCMPNLKAKIDGHNKEKFENTPPPKTQLTSCQMKRAYFTENVLQYAGVSCDHETYNPKLYKGICETTFKIKNKKTK